MQPAAEATHQQTPQRLRWLLPLFLVFLIGVFLRFYHLGQQSLWFDEGYSAWVISLSPGQLIRTIQNDVSPPLYYLILKAWTTFAGNSEVGLRSLSAVLSSLGLLLMYALAFRLTRNRLASLVAVLLYGLSVLQIQYAQEARSYGLASFLSLLSVYAIARRTTGSRGWLILAAISAGASVWLHNMMWFYLAALSLAYITAPGPIRIRTRIAELACLNLTVLLAYSPWIPSLLNQMHWLKGKFWASTPTLGDLGQVLSAAAGIKPMHLSAILSHPTLILLLITLTLATILLLSLLQRDPARRGWSLALILYGLTPILAVFTHAHFSQSFFVEKVFTASTLTLPLLSALCLPMSHDSFPFVASSLRRFVALSLPWSPILFLTLASAISDYGYFQWEQKEDWRSAIAYANTFPKDKTLIVFVANEGELLYHYYTQQQGAHPHSVTGAPQSFFALNPPRTIQRVTKPSDTDNLAALIQQTHPDHVLLVSAHWQYSDPDQLTQRRLSQEMTLADEKEFHLIKIYDYRR